MSLKITQAVAMAWALDNLGQTRSGASENSHKLRVRTCPVCGHSKWAAVFNTRVQKFECFRCAASLGMFELVRIVDQVSSTADMAVLMRLKPYAPEGVELIWKPHRPNPGEVIAPAGAPRRPDVSIAAGDEWDDFSSDWSTHVGKAVRDYAVRRSVSERWLGSGRVGYFKSGKLSGRLAFVTYENGLPVFATARAIRREVKPKYLTMANGKSSEVVFNLDLLPTVGGVAVVNEGCLSALSSGEGGVAVFGNIVSWTQAAKIARRVTKAIVIQEYGVDSLVARESAHRLAVCGCADVLIARLATEDDPNDNPAQMPEVRANAEPVSGVGEYLRMKVSRRRGYSGNLY